MTNAQKILIPILAFLPFSFPVESSNPVDSSKAFEGIESCDCLPAVVPSSGNEQAIWARLNAMEEEILGMTDELEGVLAQIADPSVDGSFLCPVPSEARLQ